MNVEIFKIFCVLVVGGLTTAWGAESSGRPTAVPVGAVMTGSPVALAKQVRALFAAKCLDCHGPDLPKPKGKFGYVLDLGRIAANRKFVIRGKPDESELYQMLIHNEMPGKKSGIVVTVAEMNTVGQWITAGAPAAPNEPLAFATPAPRLPLSRRILRDLGQFHPLSTHIPVGLLFASLPAEFMWWLTRKPTWKAIVRFCVIVGALGAMSAATLGWCNAEFTSYAGATAAVLTWHRVLGTITAGWAAILVALGELSQRRDHPRYLSCWFQVMLVAGAVLVGTAGYLGAELVYGLDHYKF